MNSYDVLGLTLDDAIGKFEALGIDPEIIETSSLRKGVGEEGIARVVKQIEENGSQTIIVCKIPDKYR